MKCYPLVICHRRESPSSPGTYGLVGKGKKNKRANKSTDTGMPRGDEEPALGQVPGRGNS